MMTTSTSSLVILILILVISVKSASSLSISTSGSGGIIIRKSLFPGLPARCPAQCTCDTDNDGKKRVSCLGGGHQVIPTHQMDKETQVIHFAGSQDRPNFVTIGRIFLELPFLEDISIVHSSLPMIGDSSFWPGRHLVTLDLSHNKIRLIRDSDFTGLINLKSLNLSDNHLGVDGIPSAPFRHLTNLTYLSLARNKIVKLVPRLFYQLNNLQVLDISENPLTNANISSETFKDIRGLHVLKMDKCQIAAISVDTYKELPNLIELHLTDNKLTSILSFEFTSLSATLRSLHLDGNDISVIRDNAFFGLRLVHLGLSRNLLHSLPSCTFCNLQVESLDISSNHFVMFQSDLLLPLGQSLIALYAAANKRLEEPSVSVGRLISPLKSAQIVRLGQCRLDDSMGEDIFSRLNNLTTLDLSTNYLTNVSGKWFRPLYHLQVLDLSSNLIKGLDMEVIMTMDSLPSLRAIYLQGNPWSCRKCHIWPLLDWIRSRSPQSYLNVCGRSSANDKKSSNDGCVTCTSPDYLMGRPLHSITSDDDLMSCPDDRIIGRVTNDLLSDATLVKTGLYACFVIIISLFVVIIFLTGYYRRRYPSASYYTREEVMSRDLSSSRSLRSSSNGHYLSHASLSSSHPLHHHLHHPYNNVHHFTLPHVRHAHHHHLHQPHHHPYMKNSRRHLRSCIKSCRSTSVISSPSFGHHHHERMPGGPNATFSHLVPSCIVNDDHHQQSMTDRKFSLNSLRNLSSTWTSTRRKSSSSSTSPFDLNNSSNNSSSSTTPSPKRF